MNLAYRQCNEPDTSLDIVFLDVGSLCPIDRETAGIQAPLAVITQEEVGAFGHGVVDLGRITTRRRVSIGTAGILAIEVWLMELDLLCRSFPGQVHQATANRDVVSSNADHAFDVVLLLLIWGSKDDDVSSCGFAQMIREFVDDDVLLVLERINHGAPLYLKWRYEERTNRDDNRHNDDDIEGNIEQVEDEAVVVLGRWGRHGGHVAFEYSRESVDR